MPTPKLADRNIKFNTYAPDLIMRSGAFFHLLSLTSNPHVSSWAERSEVEPRRDVQSTVSTRDSKILFEIPTLCVALRVRLRPACHPELVELLEQSSKSTRQSRVGSWRDYAQDDAQRNACAHYVKLKYNPVWKFLKVRGVGEGKLFSKSFLPPQKINTN